MFKAFEISGYMTECLQLLFIVNLFVFWFSNFSLIQVLSLLLTRLLNQRVCT
jgi:hypothetical protein